MPNIKAITLTLACIAPTLAAASPEVTNITRGENNGWWHLFVDTPTAGLRLQCVLFDQEQKPLEVSRSITKPIVTKVTFPTDSDDVASYACAYYD